MLAVVGVACTPSGGETTEDPGNHNQGGSTFVLDVYNVSVAGAFVEVTPSNDDYYYCSYIRKGHFEQYGAEGAMQLIVEDLINKSASKGVSLTRILSMA